ncbi:MAG: esterase-like activity of phytase family protein, partial [Holophagales bacterium]|nr:esterase-like activity of phytase family protein [Holophagales bacterium]
YSHGGEARNAGAVAEGGGAQTVLGALESLARQPGRLLEIPEAFDGIDDNGGLEAVTELADGRLLIFAEEGRDAEGDTRGWVGDPETGEWQELSLALTVDPEVGDLRPTAATTLPSGDVVLLERGWQAISGVMVKVAYLPVGQIEGGERLMPFELGRLRAPFTVDNFEAIDATTGPGGEILLYLLADDNFRDDQRTLLLQFEIIGELPGGAMRGLDR